MDELKVNDKGKSWSRLTEEKQDEELRKAIEQAELEAGMPTPQPQAQLPQFIRIGDSFSNVSHVKAFDLDAEDDIPVLKVIWKRDKVSRFTGQQALDIYSQLIRHAPAPAPAKQELDGSWTMEWHGHQLLIHTYKNSDWGITVLSAPGCFTAGATLAEALAGLGDALVVHLGD